MNGLSFAHLLKTAVVSCALVSCLLALYSPAFAIAIYDAVSAVSVTSPPQPGPPQTGQSPGVEGIAFPQAGIVPVTPVEIGNAIAVSSGSTSDIPEVGAVVTRASGSASAPPNSFAQSLATGFTVGTLLNQNATSVGFPLTIDHGTLLNTVSTGPIDFADAHISYQVLLDGAVLASDNGGCSVGPSAGSCSRAESGSVPLVVALTPGIHTLLITTETDGFASALNPVPEPTSLLLFGATAAGLGLARWRQRRPKQQC